MNSKLQIATLFFALCSICPTMQAENMTDIFTMMKKVAGKRPFALKSAAASLLLLFVATRYYKNKKTPKPETISAEAKMQRWQEIKNEKDIVKKIKLLLSYIDDFYIGVRPKEVEITKKEIRDGHEVTIKDKEVVRPAIGFFPFFYKNVLDGLEDFGKLTVLFSSLLFGFWTLSEIPSAKG